MGPADVINSTPPNIAARFTVHASPDAAAARLARHVTSYTRVGLVGRVDKDRVTVRYCLGLRGGSAWEFHGRFVPEAPGSVLQGEFRVQIGAKVVLGLNASLSLLSLGFAISAAVAGAPARIIAVMALVTVIPAVAVGTLMRRMRPAAWERAALVRGIREALLASTG